jgi:hypothetical protein
MAAPRKHRDQTYRKSDLVRAFRAAEAAGIKSPRIEVDRHGTIAIIPAKPEGVGENEWDTVLSNDPATA